MLGLFCIDMYLRLESSLFSQGFSNWISSSFTRCLTVSWRMGVLNGPPAGGANGRICTGDVAPSPVGSNARFEEPNIAVSRSSLPLPLEVVWDKAHLLYLGHKQLRMNSFGCVHVSSHGVAITVPAPRAATTTAAYYCQRLHNTRQQNECSCNAHATM